ncbi:peptide chain release factor 1 [Flammeovirga yaeyamensis]|uniref:Peptide chain release factor 1 n=1 Tax=Flammeovirga yaeyamensis TaxID=367791 RepID=A0AAX1N3X5_9BACT|nr:MULTISPECIES: peptide chain release factor 1 [Flammeovirga]ANQ50282.1 peptide chain release factor 1 [Flammeovirga sp. MY04]MBB3699769.1 peptide chain release factor 1 [Flammeovirga yaeyamensis]NMF36662.1 peptide chain release factor 1 [Flammeovirga yaeyamensis]QWG02293.1 peptide chain release factor 1 [Flammeovirga yaeyamensis]
MLDKLEKIKLRFDQVSEDLVKPETVSDMKLYAKLNKEYKDLQKVVDKYFEYKAMLEGIDEAKEILEEEKDPELREMAKMELDELQDGIPTIEEELKMLLIPKDPNDSKNAIFEIRAGAGGDEASIFAGDLLRMYQRFCERHKWKLSITDFVDGTSGGFNKIVANIQGEDAYGMLKYEAGVHRVQRVPATESQGRIHTSVASVAVLPEMDDVEIELNMSDIRRDEFCSSGPGGQSVNTTYSAIRLTHLPTGIIVQCQDEKSKLKNYDKALKELKSRLYAIEEKKRQEEIGAERKSMVGSGARSDKIRTYNYPQGRVTDHRINHSVFNLPIVMDGEIQDFIDRLRIADNLEKMENSGLA